MLRVKTILFPTDFSPTSDAALTTACHWARRLGAELHIFHALESLRPDLYPTGLGMIDPAIASLRMADEAGAALEARRRLATNQGATVTCATAQGLAAAPMILDYAEAHDIDLIAMSTHGRRGIRRLLLGSVAEEVVQRSSCPVLTVGGGSASLHSLSPKRILVAVDLSDHSAAAVALGKQLAGLFSAEMQVLHVLVRSPLPAFYDGTGGIPNLPFVSPLLEKEALAVLEKLYQRAPGTSGSVSIHLEHGVAVDEILRFAAVNSSDLVVVASHGLTGVSHLLMGSVAERVVRQASCPVLALKSFGKSIITEAETTPAASRAASRR